MKLDLSENNIFLTFRKLGFDENSMLISVEYQVKYERYMASDKLENLTDDSHLGFLIDQSKEKKFDIACGNLDDIKKKFSLN